MTGIMLEIGDSNLQHRITGFPEIVHGPFPEMTHPRLLDFLHKLLDSDIHVQGLKASSPGT